MQIVHTIGTVTCVNVGDEFSLSKGIEVAFCAIIEDLTNAYVPFVIWIHESSPSASDLALHNMWLSMLREAMATGRKVHIGHEEFNGLMLSLE